MAIKIYIDQGHNPGSPNAGAEGNGYREQDITYRVGIELAARYMTWDAFLTAVNEGRTQMFNLGWIGDYPDPENFLQLFHSKNVSPGANHSNYVNPEFDKAYDAMDWKKAQEIIREDCPWIFLYSPKSYSLMWNRVENYIPTDFPYGIEKHLRLK